MTAPAPAPPRPNFLVIGAEKAGTTWAYSCLAHHPDIYVPDTKELHHFNRDDSNLKPRDHYKTREPGWYPSFFAGHRGETAIGEVTPMYLCDPEAPARIHAYEPGMKLIAILREPAARAWSHHCMAKAKGHVAEPLDAILARDPADERFLRRGEYARQLAAYDALFPKEQILVLVFEEVMADRAAALDEIALFLGVEPQGFEGLDADRAENAAGAYKSPVLNELGINTARFLRSQPALRGVAQLIKSSGANAAFRRLNKTEQANPPLPPDLAARLRRRYAPDVAALEARLGRPITAWQPAPAVAETGAETGAETEATA